MYRHKQQWLYLPCNRYIYTQEWLAESQRARAWMATTLVYKQTCSSETLFIVHFLAFVVGIYIVQLHFKCETAVSGSIEWVTMVIIAQYPWLHDLTVLSTRGGLCHAGQTPDLVQYPMWTHITKTRPVEIPLKISADFPLKQSDDQCAYNLLT